MVTFGALIVCANGVLAAEIAGDAQMQARTLLSGTTYHLTKSASEESVTPDGQEQARQFIIGSPSVGRAPNANISLASKMSSKPEESSLGKHRTGVDAQEMAGRTLRGEGV